MKLTDWYSGNVKPVRKGVYEVEFFFNECYQPMYANWNGKFWGMRGWDVIHARFLKKRESTNQFPQWRGVAK